MVETRRGQLMAVAAVASGGAALSDEVLVAASAGHRVAVYGLVLSSDTAEVVTFESGGSTLLWEVYPGANGGAVLPLADYPWLVALEGESLTVTTTTTSKVTVLVQYGLVK